MAQDYLWCFLQRFRTTARPTALTLLLKQWVSPAGVLTGKGVRYLQPADPVETPPSHVQPLAEAKCSTPCSTEVLLAEIVRRVLREIG